MSSTPRAITIEALLGRLTDVMSAQVSDLREYGGAVAAGQGTIHLERSLRALELRRAALYLQFEEIAFAVPPAPVTSPDKLDLTEDN